MKSPCVRPIIAIQNALPPEQGPLGLSLAIFTQTFGGSLALTIAQLVFWSSLEVALPKFAPTANVQAIIHAGATGFRSVVSPSELPAVLRSYAYAVDKTFYVALCASAGTFVFAWGMGWQKIQKKKTPAASGMITGDVDVEVDGGGRRMLTSLEGTLQ